MGKFVKTLVATTSISLILAAVPTNVFAEVQEGIGKAPEQGAFGGEIVIQGDFEVNKEIINENIPEEKEERKYVIHHYLCGTETKVAEDEDGSIEVGQPLKADKSDKLYDDYKGVEVTNYKPSQEVTVKEEHNTVEITVEYVQAITLTAGSAEKVYDGKPLTQEEFTVEGLLKDDSAEDITASMKKDSMRTSVGEQMNAIDPMSVKFKGEDVPDYYRVNYVEGTLKVTKKPLKITGVSDSKVYNGKEQMIEGFDVEGLIEGDMISGLSFMAKGTEVGKYVGEFNGDLVIKRLKEKNINEVNIVDDSSIDLTNLIFDDSDTDYELITDNYEPEYEPGVLEITAAEEPKTMEPTTVEPKKEEPKAEAPKTESPKTGDDSSIPTMLGIAGAAAGAATIAAVVRRKRNSDK